MPLWIEVNKHAISLQLAKGEQVLARVDMHNIHEVLHPQVGTTCFACSWVVNTIT